MDFNFSSAIEFVLLMEGGYVFDKDDPGGETKYGISKKAYPKLDIKNLSLNKAKEIYKRDYWDRVGCEGLLFPLNLVIFDTAVNMGVRSALKMLDFFNQNQSINYPELLLLRIDYYRAIVTSHPNLAKYLNGWTGRVSKLYHFIKSQR